MVSGFETPALNLLSKVCYDFFTFGTNQQIQWYIPTDHEFLTGLRNAVKSFSSS